MCDPVTKWVVNAIMPKAPSAPPAPVKQQGAKAPSYSVAGGQKPGAAGPGGIGTPSSTLLTGNRGADPLSGMLGSTTLLGK